MPTFAEQLAGGTNLNSPAYLTNLIYPSTDGRWRDIFRSGWSPSGFNQQWGGAYVGHELMDSASGSIYKFSPLSGQIQDDSFNQCGASANYYLSSGFKVAETTTPQAIWLKLYKVGSANRPVTVNIYTDNGSGLPNSLVTNGTSSTVNLMQVTSNPVGEWYRFNFPTPPSLTSGTQYHIVATQSAADSSNYIAWKCTTARKYPYGFVNAATSTPTWSTVAATSAQCFMVEPISSNLFLQPAGLFDQKLVFGGGGFSQVAQTKALMQPLKNFFDGSNFTYLTRWTNPGSSSQLFDFSYGLDHDRIVCGTNASGFPFVTLFTQAGSVFTITGTVSISAGNQDLAVVARMVGDGADYLKLYVNGVSVGTPYTGQSMLVDPLFRELGTAVVGGGWTSITPSWTLTTTGASLPSAQGWTWTGTATEANAMTVVNNKLYQNKNGYAATDTGYYAKTVALNNATGWSVSWKARVGSSSYSPVTGECAIGVQDGTKKVDILVQECTLTMATTSPSTADFVVQLDNRSVENVFTLVGKGSDVYLFVNGKLLIDGSGKFTQTTGTNLIYFGDGAAVSGANADIVWSYIKYSSGGAISQSPVSGASLSEAAFWSTDRSALLPILYNNGSNLAVKQYCGVEKSYVETPVKTKVKRNIFTATSSSSVYPATTVVGPELNTFFIGSNLSLNNYLNISSTVAGAGIYPNSYVDAKLITSSAINTSSSGSNSTQLSFTYDLDTNLGLHVTLMSLSVSSGTASLSLWPSCTQVITSAA